MIDYSRATDWLLFGGGTPAEYQQPRRRHAAQSTNTQPTPVWRRAGDTSRIAWPVRIALMILPEWLLREASSFWFATPSFLPSCSLPKDGGPAGQKISAAYTPASRRLFAEASLLAWLGASWAVRAASSSALLRLDNTQASCF